MHLKVLGTGCVKCQALTVAVKAAADATGQPYQLEKVTDWAAIAAHGVMATPALVVDGKVVSTGKLLTPAEIRAFLGS